MRQLPRELHDKEYSLEDIHDAQETSKLAAEMDLKRGDCYEWGRAIRQVVSIDTRFPPKSRESLTVTNPMVSHPQDSESGEWLHSLGHLYVGWRQGRVDPTTLTIVSSRNTIVPPI